VRLWPPAPLPLALGPFHVLLFYIETGVSPFAALRAVGVAIAVSLVLWVGATLVSGDRDKGTVLSAIAIVALGANADLATLAILGVLLVVVALLLPRARQFHIPWSLATPAANGLALILALTLLIRGAQNGTLAQLPRELGWAAAGAGIAAFSGKSGTPGADPDGVADAPDIYILMLEDYPRADTLQRLFGFDNAEFLSALEDRGFTVAPKSRTNYSSSLLSLIAMFHARHIEAIPALDRLRSADVESVHLTLRDALNSGVTLDLLRRHGYTIVAASPGYEDLTLRSADRFFDAGQLNDFELFAVKNTTALSSVDPRAFPDLFGEQFRARVRAEFDFLSQVAQEASSGPKFVFVHVPAPHAPILFGSQGEPISVPADPYQFDLSERARFASQYVAQLRHLNQLTLEALDGMGPSSRPAVTIVMSDEGGWFTVGLDPDPAARAQLLLAELFAARAPAGEDLFGPSITTVNIMPILLERYLAEALPRQTDRSFVTTDAALFLGVDFPNTDASAA
jgi:hypothetical protein